jgi:hypothetical protein
MVDEYDMPQEEAKFNMALDTLQRLGEILRQVKNVSISPELEQGLKQRTKLILLKQFFIQASPLLDSKNKDALSKGVFKIQENKQRVIGKTSGKFLGYQTTYNPDLEDEIDLMFIKLQDELQKQKYFMPPKDESALF